MPSKRTTNAAPKHPLALTIGDPAGIGPEVVVKALTSPKLAGQRLLVIGDRGVLQRTADALALPLTLDTFTDEAAALAADSIHALLDLANVDAHQLRPGEPTADAGRASLDYIEKAIELTRTGRTRAIVTGPINKEAILKTGCQFPGHTELLAARTGAPRVVMMLAGGPWRVGLVTTHIALRDVPDALDADNICETLRIVHESLRRFFRIEQPRIGVCGLNPHASDGGRFGDEEATIIAPAIERARAGGIDIAGPVPPDAMFTRDDRFDAIVAMYHDQGLIPLKMAVFDSGVNITLGLPIVRTSVDHGTAYDIVGRDLASPNSLIEAVKLADHMSRQQ